MLGRFRAVSGNVFFRRGRTMSDYIFKKMGISGSFLRYLMLNLALFA